MEIDFVHYLIFIGIVLSCCVAGYLGARIGLYFHLRKCFKRGQIGDHFFYLLRKTNLYDLLNAWNRIFK